MRTALFIPLFFFLIVHGKSQELNCSVQVTAQQVQGSDRKIFETLQTSIYEFMNNRIWTNYQFKLEERIECSFVLVISERRSSDQFSGTATVVLRRPVFNSSYFSTSFNLVDKDINFEYVEFQPLEYSDNSFTTNLTSILAFYAYMLIGLDFDTFSQYGGTPFFEKAEAVVNAAQNAAEPGWKAFESQKNRYWLVENMLNSAYSPLRKFQYEYHLKGLDEMYESAEKGRENIVTALDYLKEVNNNRPGLFLTTIIMDAKSNELVNVFSEGSPQQKTAAINILQEVDPANSSKYQDIMKRN
jgi:hypothetical protein